MPRLPFVCATLFAALSSSYSHSDFSITTERTQYSPGDSITLMVESTNPSDSPIDLSPLQQDFIVLDQRKLMINSYAEGKRNSTVRWEIQLRSRKSGAVEVPALNYNDEQSESISLFVRSQERSRFLPVSDMPIILDAQISLDDNYEQAQFLYVLNVYSDQPLTPGYTVSAPKIERARVELLDTSETQDIEIRGKNYRFFEQRYAIFPTEMGRFVVEGPVFAGSQQNYPNTQVRANNLEINVRARLNFDADTHWLPVQSVDLTERWELPPTPKAGDTAIRTLTLSAQGSNAAQLPQIVTSPPNIVQALDSQVTLTDTINDSGVLGTRVERHRYQLVERGEVTFDAIEIPWWNVRTDTAQSARLEKKIIEVAAGANGESSIEREKAQNAAPDSGDQPVQIVATQSNWLIWLLGALALLTSIGWLFNLRKIRRLKDREAEAFNAERNQPETDELDDAREEPRFETPVETPKESLVEAPQPITEQFDSKAELSAFQNLGRSCLKGDTATVQPNLITWAKLFWYEQQIEVLEDVASAADNASLNVLLAELDESMYNIGAEPWQGKSLFHTLSEIRSR